MYTEFYREQMYLAKKHNVKVTKIKIQEEINGEVSVYIGNGWIRYLDNDFYNEFLQETEAS